MANYTIEVVAICQKSSYGAQKPHLTGDSKFTKSAKHLRFNAADIGLVSPQSKENKTANVTANFSKTKTTESFRKEVDYETAFHLLNRVDVSTMTPDYLNKRSAYNTQKQLVLKTVDPTGLDGMGKLTYYNQLRAFCFDYYTLKFRVSIKDEEGKVVKSTESKTHYRLKKFSSADFEQLLASVSKKATAETIPVLPETETEE